MAILNRIFPKQFDNSYRGHWLSLWLLVPIALVKATQGVNSIIMTREVAMKADGIPLESFDGPAAATVVALFALVGLYALILPLQSLLVLIRYRAMVPFMFLMLLLFQGGGRLLLLLNPLVRSSAQSITFGGFSVGTIINLAILAVTVLGFVLSLQNRESAN
jgi:hypothetical protein